MAEDVMAGKDRIFAAVYCGDEPSVLPYGQAPATPLIRKGAVGVVCEITDHERVVGKITDQEKTYDGISIRARAFSRCAVNEVSPLGEPYLTIDAGPVIDREEEAFDHIAEMRAAKAVHDVERLVDYVYRDPDDDPDDDSDEALRYDVIRRFSPDADLGELERSYCLVEGASSFCPSRRELYSFGLLSTLDLTTFQRVKALQGINTTARFHQVSKDIEEGRNWLAFRAGLKGFFDDDIRFYDGTGRSSS